MPVLLLLGLLTLYVLFLYLIGRRTQAKQVVQRQADQPDDSGADTDIVLKAIENVNGVTAPYWLLAIAAHETGNFTSAVFRNNNNLFGMRHPTIRQTTSQGDRNGYAWYNSIEDSVRDYLLWLQSQNAPEGFSDISELISFMKERSYFEASYSSYNNAVSNHLIEIMRRYE